MIHRFFTIVLLSLSFTYAVGQEVLINKDVVSMVTAKVSQDLVLTKISTSKCQFDLSPSGLIDLKTARVSEKLVKAMFEAAPPKTPLTNDDIVKLHEAEVSRSIILEAIKKTPGKYDVSVDGLVKLSNAKVPDAIVKEMMKVPVASQQVTGSSQVDAGSKSVSTVSKETLKATSASVDELVGWEKIIVTTIPDDVKGYTRLGDIAVSASRLYGKQAKLREEAIEKLKKEATRKKATIVYIQSENFAPTPVNTVSIAGVAYRSK